jgi:predicted MPP superfamily phosphohydrolase
MSMFILTFFALYGGMHVYAFLKARAAFGFGMAAGVVIGAWMLFMTLSPFLIRVLEQHGFDLSARTLSYIAYLWMAALFIFFCSSLVFDIVNLALQAAGWIVRWVVRGTWPLSVIPASVTVFISIVAAIAVCLYGYYSALDVRTERMTLETAKLPPGIDRFKIVQISDVHLGLIVREKRLKNIVALVEAEKPDLFVSTGDLVDAQINKMTGLAELLSQVRAPYGNYAVTGNHEYYAGLDQALDFTRKAGFRILRGEAVKDGPITIVGVDDQTQLQVDPGRWVSELQLLRNCPRGKFTLLLKHRPTVEQIAVGQFDLQLSGHTHRGQIYPFRYIAQIAYPMTAGRFDLAGGSVLRVSRGTGTWGPPVRFLSPPEVTVIELVRKPA